MNGSAWYTLVGSGWLQPQLTIIKHRAPPNPSILPPLQVNISYTFAMLTTAHASLGKTRCMYNNYFPILSQNNFCY